MDEDIEVEEAFKTSNFKRADLQEVNEMFDDNQIGNGIQNSRKTTEE